MCFSSIKQKQLCMIFAQLKILKTIYNIIDVLEKEEFIELVVQALAYRSWVKMFRVCLHLHKYGVI